MIAALTLAALASTPARAQEPPAPPRESTAVWLSLGGVLVPAAASIALAGDGSGGRERNIGALALLAGGATWGTSLGYFYAGDHRYALLSSLGKTALLGAGAGLAALQGPERRTEGDHLEVNDNPMGGVYLGLAALAVVAWDAVDVVMVPQAVRRQSEPALSLAPTRLPGGWALSLAGRL
jgi:hypothetical protein